MSSPIFSLSCFRAYKYQRVSENEHAAFSSDTVHLTGRSIFALARKMGAITIAGFLVLYAASCYAQFGTITDSTVLDACPGYVATNVKQSQSGLQADLVLKGSPCNVFGSDIKQLSLSVQYETGG